MLIGSQYADNMLYRGIKHFDYMPLTSGDIHEYTDTMYKKNAYVMNNILGYGTLNTPEIIISAEGISLSEPSVIMIEGDVALIQGDEYVPLVTSESIKSKGYDKGIVCILGWYQYISSASTLRNYGGVDNSILPNNLKNEDLNISPSGRYQLRWTIAILSEEELLSDNLSLTIEDRDLTGMKVGTSTEINSKDKKSHVFIMDTPESMKEYAVSDLYLVPILSYEYDIEQENITEAEAFTKLSVGTPFIVSREQPEGYFADGTEWYNPDSREFKTYVSESGGFVASTSKMAFLQYQSIHTITDEIEMPQDIIIPIDISEFTEGDMLKVLYEGIELTPSEHYTVNYVDNTITLLDFTTKIDDKITFTVTKIVEASDITNVTTTFIGHMATTGSDTLEGHLKLTDTLSESDSKSGLAATPKLVSDTKKNTEELINKKITDSEKTMNDNLTKLQKQINSEMNVLKDDVTGVTYKLGVENGLFYIEEV